MNRYINEIKFKSRMKYNSPDYCETENRFLRWYNSPSFVSFRFVSNQKIRKRTNADAPPTSSPVEKPPNSSFFFFFFVHHSAHGVTVHSLEPTITFWGQRNETKPSRPCCDQWTRLWEREPRRQVNNITWCDIKSDHNVPGIGGMCTSFVIPGGGKLVTCHN